jgi:putative FmdB family regulatory protein|tara:strand:- start:380 stop:799 length:420 start_codon:yes stop_codon:yes gene_type:complete
MPIYSFECRDCGRKGDVHRKVADRGNPVKCPCGKEMNRVPERFTADTFEPYYDEGLGSDVYSARDRKAIMNQLGVVEAGDQVGGARIFDEKNPNLIKKQPPIGKRKKMPKAFDDAVIEVSDAEGRTVSREISGEIPGYD